MNKNYFDILGLNVKFDINSELLEQNYTNLLAKNHPDNFEEQNEKFQASSLIFEINNAYQIIKNDISRMKYLLRINDIEINETNISHDIDFLEYIIKLTEDLLNDQSNKTLNLIKELECDLMLKFKNAFNNNDLLLSKSLCLQVIYINGIIKNGFHKK